MISNYFRVKYLNTSSFVFTDFKLLRTSNARPANTGNSQIHRWLVRSMQRYIHFTWMRVLPVRLTAQSLKFQAETSFTQFVIILTTVNFYFHVLFPKIPYFVQQLNAVLVYYFRLYYLERTFNGNKTRILTNNVLRTVIPNF